MRTVLVFLALITVLVLAPPAPVMAVQPDEILDDPVLEARARAISRDIRCMVCRNENIDDSNADLARDLRLLVRERLVDGDSDQQVKDFLVARYGEYVLLRPTAQGANLILWYAGPGLLLLGGVGVFVWLRRQRPSAGSQPAPLTEDERKRLARLTDT